MAKKKSTWVLFSVLLISALILGSTIQVGAETLNFKFYSYASKGDRVSVGDSEGHAMILSVRKNFIVFENAEIATANNVLTGDLIKGKGTFVQYITITFPDGSTIVVKEQGTLEGTAVGSNTSASTTGQIIKGTGRFEGIKGTRTGRGKYLPVEADESGPKGYGEGTLNYTLPTK